MENYRNTELGTHRSNRSPIALDPSYVVLDDSSPLDLLLAAVEQAKKLRFVKAELVDGIDWETVLENAHDDWTGFLGDAKGPLVTAFQQYFENSNAYQPAVGDPLAQPHVALFVAFLKILHHASGEINGFSKRHFEHYLHQVLQLSPLAAQPADVFVTFELSPDAAITFLPKGTRLHAGDSGIEGIFETNDDLELHAAKLAQISAFRAAFAPSGFRAMLNPNANDGGMAAIRTLIWNNGPNRRITAHGWTSFEAILADMEDRNLRKDFPGEVLEVSLDEFRRMMSLKPEALPLQKEEEELMLKWEALHARMVVIDAFPNNDRFPIAESKSLHKKLAATLYNRDALPDYKGKPVDMMDLYQDSKRPESPADAIAALAYIHNTLFLEEAEFHTLHDVDQSKQGLPKLPTSILEAGIRKASHLSPNLLRKQVTQIGATADARTLHRGATEDPSGWYPYGFVKAGDGPYSGFEAYGLLIESALLEMAEGDRKIVLTLDFAPMDFALLVSAFQLSEPSPQDWYSPFEFRVSSEKDWVAVDWRSSVPKLRPTTRQVEFTLTIPAHLPAITGPGEKFPDPSMYGKGPLLNLRLAIPKPGTPPANVSHHLLARILNLLNIQLLVEVKGITDFQAQNHQSQLNIAAPFEPFGNSPASQSEWMLAHPEICLKPLQSLEIQFEWMGVPSDVKQYYDPYFVKMGDSPAITNIPHAKADFKVTPRMVTGRWAAKLSATDVPFLEPKITLQPLNLEPLDAEYSEAQIAKWKTPTDWPRYFSLVYNTDWSPQQEYERAQRRLTAALIQTSNDFATASMAYSANPNGSEGGKTNALRFSEASTALNTVSRIQLQPPYIPKLKRISLGYTAHVVIPMGQWNQETKQKARLYHQMPFGYRSLPIGLGSPQPLFPSFQNEGSVMIGLKDLAAGQRISLLLKVQPGSGNPEVQPPAIRWWYQSYSGWRQLPAQAVQNDETNGLTQTGILQLAIPEDATVASTEMPGQLHWVMASVERDAEDLPDWQNLHIHALRARQVIEVGKTPIHWFLPEGTVSSLEGNNPSVGKVMQPYPSIHGKPAESIEDFYKRISERLRHKNRALTAWDYEHICLGQFPQLYAVKTRPATAAVGRRPGEMDLVVVPDLRSQSFADPFRPKFGYGELNEISAFMRKHSPASALVAAHNPHYRPVVVGTTINFRDGVSSAAGKQMIQQRLKEFLAPWAFGNAKSMAFGGRLYVSEVVEVLQAEPYVDFVGKTRLFLGGDNGEYLEATEPNGDTSAYLEVGETDVLTSAAAHLINEIGDAAAQNEIWEGISWMVINSDFEVEHDPNTQAEQFDDWVGISWMVIGKDFKTMETQA